MSPILFHAPKASLSSLWQPSTALTQRKTDSRPSKEVCRQVDQNNNKTGVRGRKGKRTDPNNGQAVAWHAMKTDYPLFIAVQSWVIYFFSSMSSKGSWHKTSSQSWPIHVIVSGQRGEPSEGSCDCSCGLVWTLHPGQDSPWLLLTLSLSLSSSVFHAIDMMRSVSTVDWSKACDYLPLTCILMVWWGYGCCINKSTMLEGNYIHHIVTALMRCQFNVFAAYQAFCIITHKSVLHYVRSHSGIFTK